MEQGGMDDGGMLEHYGRGSEEGEGCLASCLLLPITHPHPTDRHLILYLYKMTNQVSIFHY